MTEYPVGYATEVARVAAAMDDRPGLVAPAGAKIGPDGMIYIFDDHPPVVRAYDRSGSVVREYGGLGEGPGEFAVVGEFGFHSDTLWVFDHLLRRFSLFRLAGTLLRTINAQNMRTSVVIEKERVTLAPTKIDAVGRMIGVPVEVTWTGERDSLQVPRLVFSEDGSVTDTLSSVWAFSFATERRSVEVAGLRVLEQRPLSHILRAQDDAGIVRVSELDTSGSEGRFRIWRRRANGDLVFDRIFRYEPRRVEAEYRDSVLAQREVFYRRRDGVTPALRRTLSEMIEVPERYPPVSLIALGVDGSIWLRREDDMSSRRTWMVLDSLGTVRGSLELPRNLTLRWMDSARVLGLERDMIGRESVVLYEVVLSPGAP